MALVRALGWANHSVRHETAVKMKEVICQAINLDERHYSFEVVPEGSYRGDYELYLHILCDPTEERVASGQSMADRIQAALRRCSPVNTGVWLDLGSHRFWAE